MIFVDSNVLIDIFTKDPIWYEWSSRNLKRAIDQHQLAINPIIYAEISICFSRIEDLEEVLPNIFENLPISKEVSFLAGKCFLQYRKNGGQKTTTLPDFFIGAHATILKIPLLTRDVNRYKSYFPKLELISPKIEA